MKTEIAQIQKTPKASQGQTIEDPVLGEDDSPNKDGSVTTELPCQPQFATNTANSETVNLIVVHSKEPSA